MTKRRATVSGWLASAILIALVLALATSARADLSTGQISGTVTRRDTKAPVPNAVVTATAPTGSYRTKTDAKGAFSIVGVQQDTYTVAVEVQGFDISSLQGIAVTAQENTTVNVVLSPALRTIGVVRSRARPLTSAFQPDQTIDSYNYNAAGIAQLLGKTFDTDQTKLLSRLPGVTVDRQGTPLIRGGVSFETSFEYESIDYTEPNRNVTNRFQNNGNSNLLNGVGGLEIVPGGGDATHGNTGTGLIVFTAKRGTTPAYTNFDLETSVLGDTHQAGIEDSRTFARGRVSNYLSYLSENIGYQYGPYGVNAAGIGASAITPDPNANSNVNAHFGSLYTTAFFNTAAQQSRDFVDNLIFKFGRDTNQSLQFFIQSQAVRQALNYGGTAGLTIANPNINLEPNFPGGYSFTESLLYPPPGPQGFTPQQIALANATALQLLPQYPFGTAGTALGSPDAAYSPFTAYKLEYQNAFNASTFGALRFYRTFSDQTELEGDQGLYVPDSGGIRTAVATDFTKSFGTHNTVRFGGKYEFAHPFGTTSDNIDYNAAYGIVQPFTQIPSVGLHNVYLDFLTPAATYAGACSTGATCGFLGRYFPTGVPSLPSEVELPTANQQSYGLYAQDTFSPNTRLKILAGLRLDGYNFLLPNDPANPPAVDGIRHQRLYQPKVGVAYRLGNRDALRANFGRSLAIPLPTFLGLDLQRANYAAFQNVPSYDNAKGPFDPLRPNATRATYCGPGVQEVVGGRLTTQGTQPCANYADQLYWLMRNYRFSTQSQFTYPLRGATFTNYDVSYSHEFPDGIAFKVTPFYRRGYDVVETTRTLLGYDPNTEVASLSPEGYSNLGVQDAAGVEFALTSPPATVGLSYQATATYINQIGNTPPGTYLPTASVQLGELYRSPQLAPFQSTLGITYRTRSGFSVNPIFSYRYGYPYGEGVYQAQTIGGVPVFVPLTDALVTGSQSSLVSNAFVNPQNPGTVSSPNIVATRGYEALTGPGTLRSKAQLNTDLNIEYKPLGTHLTFGLGFINLFDQTADIPTVNLSRAFLPVSNGVFVDTGALTSNNPTHQQPVAVGSSTLPYIVYPNQPPTVIRFYVQAGV